MTLRSSFEIRPFHSRDRARVFQIAADTAFFGNPLEHFFEDRSLFCDAFCAYYTDYEPEHAWVAESEHKIVGYLLGCADTRRMNRDVWRRTVPILLYRLGSGAYRFGRQSQRYLWELMKAQLNQELLQPNLTQFPAHLHINVQVSERGKGIGKALLEQYLGQLSFERVRGVHLKTTSENEAACALYEKLGFTLIDARRTNLWKPWLGREVENRCYAMSLP